MGFLRLAKSRWSVCASELWPRDRQSTHKSFGALPWVLADTKTCMRLLFSRQRESQNKLRLKFAPSKTQPTSRENTIPYNPRSNMPLYKVNLLLYTRINPILSYIVSRYLSCMFRYAPYDNALYGTTSTHSCQPTTRSCHSAPQSQAVRLIISNERSKVDKSQLFRS